MIFSNFNGNFNLLPPTQKLHNLSYKICFNSFYLFIHSFIHSFYLGEKVPQHERKPTVPKVTEHVATPMRSRRNFVEKNALGVVHQIVSLILEFIHYDFFFNWQTEKKTCFGPIRNLFSFSSTQTEKNFVDRIGKVANLEL